MKIYDSQFSPSCRKVRAVAFELDLKPQYVPVDLFGGGQREPAFLALNQNALVPVLVDGDLVLWESNAILGYLAHGTRLLPTGRRERAEVDRWSSWQLAHIGPAVFKVAFERYLKPRIGKGAADEAVVAEGTHEFRRLVAVLEEGSEAASTSPARSRWPTSPWRRCSRSAEWSASTRRSFPASTRGSSAFCRARA